MLKALRAKKEEDRRLMDFEKAHHMHVCLILRSTYAAACMAYVFWSAGPEGLDRTGAGPDRTEASPD